MSDKLKIYNVLWSSVTGGPSPEGNVRTELFLAGCAKAEEGNPCKGCFNPQLWKDNVFVGYSTPLEAADNIQAHAANKYITIVGGEPLDQLAPLAELVSILKARGFHIIVFTHYLMRELRENFEDQVSVDKLLRHIDILVDGEYDETQRIYDDNAGDGLHDAVGSANQIIWDLEAANASVDTMVTGIPAGELEGIYVCPDFQLRYITKDEEAEDMQMAI